MGLRQSAGEDAKGGRVKVRHLRKKRQEMHGYETVTRVKLGRRKPIFILAWTGDAWRPSPIFTWRQRV